MNELNKKLKTENILFSWMQNLLGIERHLGDNTLQVALVVSKESLPLVGDFRAICNHFFGGKVTVYTPQELLGNEIAEACDVNSLSDNFETIKALRKYFHDQKLSGDLVLDITSSTKIYSCAASILSSGDSKTKVQYVNSNPSQQTEKTSITIFMSNYQSEFNSKE